MATKGGMKDDAKEMMTVEMSQALRSLLASLTGLREEVTDMNHNIGALEQ